MLVKEVPFHQEQVGSRYSSSLAKCVTPPSHQHPILCDPPSHGATRPAVLPGPGQWLHCPLYCPASCPAAGMPHPPPSVTQPLIPQCHSASFTQSSLWGKEEVISSLNTFLSEAYPTPLADIFISKHFADRLVYTIGDSGLHDAS